MDEPAGLAINITSVNHNNLLSVPSPSPTNHTSAALDHSINSAHERRNSWNFGTNSSNMSTNMNTSLNSGRRGSGQNFFLQEPGSGDGMNSGRREGGLNQPSAGNMFMDLDLDVDMATNKPSHFMNDHDFSSNSLMDDESSNTPVFGLTPRINNDSKISPRQPFSSSGAQGTNSMFATPPHSARSTNGLSSGPGGHSPLPVDSSSSLLPLHHMSYRDSHTNDDHDPELTRLAASPQPHDSLSTNNTSSGLNHSGGGFTSHSPFAHHIMDNDPLNHGNSLADFGTDLPPPLPASNDNSRESSRPGSAISNSMSVENSNNNQNSNNNATNATNTTINTNMNTSNDMNNNNTGNSNANQDSSKNTNNVGMNVGTGSMNILQSVFGNNNGNNNSGGNNIVNDFSSNNMGDASNSLLPNFAFPNNGMGINSAVPNFNAMNKFGLMSNNTGVSPNPNRNLLPMPVAMAVPMIGTPTMNRGMNFNNSGNNMSRQAIAALPVQSTTSAKVLAVKPTMNPFNNPLNLMNPLGLPGPNNPMNMNMLNPLLPNPMNMFNPLGSPIGMGSPGLGMNNNFGMNTNNNNNMNTNNNQNNNSNNNNNMMNNSMFNPLFPMLNFPTSNTNNNTPNNNFNSNTNSNKSDDSNNNNNSFNNSNNGNNMMNANLLPFPLPGPNSNPMLGLGLNPMNGMFGLGGINNNLGLGLPPMGMMNMNNNMNSSTNNNNNNFQTNNGNNSTFNNNNGNNSSNSNNNFNNTNNNNNNNTSASNSNFNTNNSNSNNNNSSNPLMINPNMINNITQTAAVVAAAGKTPNGNNTTNTNSTSNNSNSSWTNPTSPNNTFSPNSTNPSNSTPLSNTNTLTSPHRFMNQSGDFSNMISNDQTGLTPRDMQRSISTDQLSNTPLNSSRGNSINNGSSGAPTSNTNMKDQDAFALFVRNDAYIEGGTPVGTPRHTPRGLLVDSREDGMKLSADFMGDSNVGLKETKMETFLKTEPDFGGGVLPLSTKEKRRSLGRENSNQAFLNITPVEVGHIGPITTAMSEVGSFSPHQPLGMQGNYRRGSESGASSHGGATTTQSSAGSSGANSRPDTDSDILDGEDIGSVGGGHHSKYWPDGNDADLDDGDGSVSTGVSYEEPLSPMSVEPEERSGVVSQRKLNESRKHRKIPMIRRKRSESYNLVKRHPTSPGLSSTDPDWNADRKALTPSSSRRGSNADKEPFTRPSSSNRHRTKSMDREQYSSSNSTLNVGLANITEISPEHTIQEDSTDSGGVGLKSEYPPAGVKSEFIKSENQEFMNDISLPPTTTSNFQTRKRLQSEKAKQAALQRGEEESKVSSTTNTSNNNNNNQSTNTNMDVSTNLKSENNGNNQNSNNLNLVNDANFNNNMWNNNNNLNNVNNSMMNNAANAAMLNSMLNPMLNPMMNPLLGMNATMMNPLLGGMGSMPMGNMPMGGMGMGGMNNNFLPVNNNNNINSNVMNAALAFNTAMNQLNNSMTPVGLGNMNNFNNMNNMNAAAAMNMNMMNPLLANMNGMGNGMNMGMGMNMNNNGMGKGSNNFGMNNFTGNNNANFNNNFNNSKPVVAAAVATSPSNANSMNRSSSSSSVSPPVNSPTSFSTPAKSPSSNSSNNMMNSLNAITNNMSSWNNSTTANTNNTTTNTSTNTTSTTPRNTTSTSTSATASPPASSPTSSTNDRSCSSFLPNWMAFGSKGSSSLNTSGTTTSSSAPPPSTIPTYPQHTPVSVNGAPAPYLPSPTSVPSTPSLPFMNMTLGSPLANSNRPFALTPASPFSLGGAANQPSSSSSSTVSMSHIPESQQEGMPSMATPTPRINSGAQFTSSTAAYGAGSPTGNPALASASSSSSTGSGDYNTTSPGDTSTTPNGSTTNSGPWSSEKAKKKADQKRQCARTCF